MPFLKVPAGVMKLPVGPDTSSHTKTAAQLRLGAVAVDDDAAYALNIVFPFKARLFLVCC